MHGHHLTATERKMLAKHHSKAKRRELPDKAKIAADATPDRFHLLAASWLKL
jgi:hypothetical protein